MAGAPESYTLVLLDEFSNRLTYTPANMVVQYSMLLTGAENPTPKLEGDSSDDVAGSKAVMIGSECAPKIVKCFGFSVKKSPGLRP